MFKVSAGLGAGIGALVGLTYGHKLFENQSRRAIGPELNGPTGIQSARAAERSGAYLDKDAAARPTSRAASVPASHQTQQPQGKSTYVKMDGSTVEATEAQAKKWQQQRK
jgi:hypothetical protein